MIYNLNSKYKIDDYADDYTIIYRKTNYSSEDNSQNAQAITQYPTKFVESLCPISIYQLISYKYSYSIADYTDFFDSGFYPVEQNSFAWTNGDATISCYLGKNDYSVCLNINDILPMSNLGIDHYDIDVYVNDNYVATLTIDQNSDNNVLTFELPSNLLNEGDNILGFKSTPWSPAEYGSADTRQLGFAFESLVFESLN